MHEAFTAPMLLFTAAALGGVRTSLDGAWSFLWPSLMSLALGLLLLGAAAQSGAVAPGRLVAASRSALANANGAVMLAGIVLAAAQVLEAMTPARGLLGLGATFFFLTTLLLMLTAAPDATRFLRSLALLLGAALVGTHVLLAQIAAPGGSLAGRLFARALEGVTLGALGFDRHGPATGYLALAAASLLWLGLSIGRPRPEERVRPT